MLPSDILAHNSHYLSLFSSDPTHKQEVNLLSVAKFGRGILLVYFRNKSYICIGLCRFVACDYTKRHEMSEICR